MTLTVVSILVLLLLSAFFSGSETALTAASRSLMHQMENDGNTRAKTVNRLLRHREKLISTVLLGNNLVNIMASALATGLMIQAFGEAGIAYATAVMTIMVLMFAEILPKTYALIHPNRLARAVAPVMAILVYLAQPLNVIIQGLVHIILTLMGIDTSGHRTASQTLAELRGAIDLHTGEETVKEEIKHERAMLRSVLDLSDVDLEEIMVHRKQLVTIDADQPLRKVVEQVASSPYSRIPLWRDKPDNIVGVIHAKALLRTVRSEDNVENTLDIVALAARPWFVPETTNLLDQLNAFRERREHFALVVDEYGTLQGIVTLEDILEEIVGDIADEHDVAIPGVRPQSDGSYVIKGDVTIRDLNRQFEWDLPDEEAATIAGLVISESRSIPDPGQAFLFHGFRIGILRRHRNQITSLRVTAPQTLTENK